MKQGVPNVQRVETLQLLHDMAEAAAEPALRHFRQPGLSAENKTAQGFDPVTVADRAVERALRQILAARRPDDGILGEEEAPRPSASGLIWVIDPIDGTRSYLAGIPLWGTLIALNAGGPPLAGMISQPYVEERFIGGFGTAVLSRPNRPDRPLRTRACQTLSEAVLISTFPEVGTEAEGAAFHRVSRACRLTRYGTDCYGYALLALGQVDLVIEAGLQPYDIQAPQAVVEGAGGVVTDWRGGPAHQGGRILAAGDRAIHAAALAILSEVP